MSQTRSDLTASTASAGVEPSSPDDDRARRTLDPAELLALLGDEVARSVVDALVESPATALELVDELDASRATVYRRLDRLEAAGVVESSTAGGAEGRPRKRFAMALDRVALAFGEDGLRVDRTA